MRNTLRALILSAGLFASFGPIAAHAASAPAAPRVSKQVHASAEKANASAINKSKASRAATSATNSAAIAARKADATKLRARSNRANDAAQQARGRQRQSPPKATRRG